MSDHMHEPTMFQYPCYLCERETYERQRREAACICRPGDPEGWYREDCPTHGRETEERAVISRQCPDDYCAGCWSCDEDNY